MLKTTDFILFGINDSNYEKKNSLIKLSIIFEFKTFFVNLCKRKK